MIHPAQLRGFSDELASIKLAKLDPKMYAHIKDLPKKGKELVLKSLGGGRVGGYGKAKVTGFPKAH